VFKTRNGGRGPLRSIGSGKAWLGSGVRTGLGLSVHVLDPERSDEWEDSGESRLSNHGMSMGDTSVIFGRLGT